MSYNILIVDDEAAITNGLAYDIDWSRIGVLEVFKASNVPAALEYLQNNKIDVVVTDIRMPEMDGLELAARIRKQWRFAKTIFISGYDEFEYAQKAIDLGVFSYITKPIPNEHLVETVARALCAIEAELDNTRIASRSALDRDEVLTALRERELNGWIANDKALPDAQSLERAEIRLGGELFLTLVRLDGRGVNGTDSAMESTLAGMMDSILFAGHGRELHFTDDAGNIIIVASLEKHDGLEDALRFMKGMAEPFQTSVNRATGYTVSLFFGSIVRVDLAHAEYLRLLEQSRTRFVGEPGVIMVPESSSADVVGSRAGVQGSRTHRLVEQVRSYVEQNINKEITVADIAAYLHLHPNYLLRLFKEETGEAIIEFLIHARIQKAKELLVDSQMKIYEVAEYVGYDSVSHFSRIFKRETGISPKVFQQQR